MSKLTPYEFGAERFKDAEGLGSILSRGYFREGSAWGSIRCGWREVVPWTHVLEVFRRECPGNWMAQSNGVVAGAVRFNCPWVVRQGASSKEGNRLWLQGTALGFGHALGALWAEIDASEMDQLVASVPKETLKKKAKPKPGNQENMPSKPEGERGARRL